MILLQILFKRVVVNNTSVKILSFWSLLQSTFTHYCYYLITFVSVYTQTINFFLLMPSSHCTILARFFTRRQVFDKSPTNAWHRRQIGARCVADTHKIFGMLNIWSCWRFTILLCEWVLAEKYISNDLQPMREQDVQGSGKLGEDFFFYKAINVSHLQTMCIHFGIIIYRPGRLHEDEEGARVFSVNNILL